MNSQPASQSLWFGQPRGLTILFLTEMWEQFSFYGMRALLVYYLTAAKAVPQGQASLIYGAYTGFIFLTPLLGGWLADRWLGKHRAVLLGGAIMAFGHFMMVFEPLTYPAMAVLAIGGGLFVPSLPSQVRELYAPEDPRRAGAYYVYYVGINLGSLLAPLICGALGEKAGWHWGFGAAGIGMLVGLGIYAWGMRWLPGYEARASVPSAVSSRQQGREAALHDFAPVLRLFAGVILAVVLFRGAYEQLGNTLALWAQEGVNRQAGRFLIPVTWFQSLNPLFVFTLTPVILAWRRRSQRHAEAACDRDSALVSMSTGSVVVGAAYLVLACLSLNTGPQGVHWLWLVLAMGLITWGELCILPVGLSLFGRLAPQNLAATSIAAWFFTGFVGNLLAGALGTLWSVLGACAFFVLMAGICVLAAGWLAMLLRCARRRTLSGPAKREVLRC